MKSYLASTVATSAFALVTIAGCGGDLDPGAGNDPGTGTATLTINGSVRAQPQLSNARSAADYTSEMSVRIELAGVPVTSGTVTMTSSGGTVALAFAPQAGGDGRWEATAAGYDEVYVLDVVSGTDKVTGVRVDGPDIHVFDAPLAGATVDATAPLPVAWTREDTAASASIRCQERDAVSIPDSGSYTVTPGSLKSEKDKAVQNTIELTRENRVTPAGAAGGSELSVTVENNIEVVASPNPNA